MSLESRLRSRRLGKAWGMQASDRAAVWVGSILSVVVGLWALLSLASPFGPVGGAAALFGLAFGGLALLAHARGRWRRTVVVGIAVNSLALLGAVGELVYFMIAG
jgi:membrane associated rhomboid family serine protease